MIKALIVLAIIIFIVFMVRLFGAWMLRINEVIAELKKTNYKLEQIIIQIDIKNERD